MISDTEADAMTACAARGRGRPFERARSIRTIPGLRLAFALLAWPMPSFAEPPSLEPPEPPPIRSHRFDEDWRAYCAAHPDPPAVYAPKCLRLGAYGLASLGGELRVRLEGARDPEFGLETSRDRVALLRAMAHLDVRVGSHLRGFAQIGSFHELGRDDPRAPTDEDRLDWVQAFAELEAGAPVGRVALRAGRQEMSFGSARLVGVREATNVRRAFTGGRAFWQAEDGRVDALYALPVELEPDVFDDAVTDDEALYGLYATKAIAGPLSLDAYWLGFEQDRATYASVAGSERRHSLGLRLSGASERLDWDVETIVQLGEVEDRDIRAWTFASDLGLRRADWPLRPRLSLKTDVASGDRRGDDGTLGTFNALYPRFSYFSEAIVVVPSNIVDVHVALELQPLAGLTFELGWNPVWRQDTSDAVYAARLVPIAGTAGRSGRFTAHQTIVGVEWTFRRAFSLVGQYVHAVPSGLMRDFGGDTVDFGTVSISLKH